MRESHDEEKEDKLNRSNLSHQQDEAKMETDM